MPDGCAAVKRWRNYFYYYYYFIFEVPDEYSMCQVVGLKGHYEIIPILVLLTMKDPEEAGRVAAVP